MKIEVYLNEYFDKLIEKANNDEELLKSIRRVIQNTPIAYFKNTLQDTRQYSEKISNLLKN